LLAISILCGLYFYTTFYVLIPATKLGNQWNNYINPLNLVFLFFGGVLIGKLFKDRIIHPIISVAAIFTGLSLFIFFPVSGDEVNLVTGFNRIIFTFCCFLICFGSYKLTYQIPSFAAKPLKLLGQSSYSIYLIHPIIYHFTSKLPEQTRLLSSIIATLVVSYFVYLYFERYFMNFSKQIKLPFQKRKAFADVS
jgi:peptidoglycan/LPS O-acetylase OafA/YrhL